MARKATLQASSYWLPGFEPDASMLEQLTGRTATPAPATVIEIASVETIAVNEDVKVVEVVTSDQDASSPTRAASWRLSLVAPTSAPVATFPRLQQADLTGLATPLARFEANLHAIDVLAQVEAGQRQPDAQERRSMQRYVGWGSLPAAFNPDGADPAWADRARALEARLDAEDHASARASVNNSHYTPLSVIDAVWSAVVRLGFTGGRILEPAAGIGHFIGAMPQELAQRSQVTAIEIDRLSGRLLQALYGPAGVAVHIAPFEKSPLPDQWFDLVIGNVPFGKFPAADTSHRPYARFSIHNYFIARSLELVRPGGLVALITSSHTLESNRTTVRQYLASQAHLLGAIRLPMGSFAEAAGTDAQSDLLILRRRQGSEAVEGDWIERRQAPACLIDPGNAQPYIQVNAWYAARPDWHIGRLRMESNGYGKVPMAVYEGDLEAALKERIALLPESVYTPAPVATPVMRPTVSAEPGARPGTFRVHQGRLHRVDGTSMIDVDDQFSATQKGRIAGMCAIRNRARELLDAQLAEDGDEKLRPLRAMLNGTYDSYVRKYGCLSTRANALAFRRDPDYPLLLSLEHYDEETDTARKASLFTQRTLRRVCAPTSADEPTAALAASMQWRGRVDAAYMAGLLGAPEETVLAALAEAGHIFRDPRDQVWRTADEYLSGNVRVKLEQARMGGQAYRANVLALEAVQPEDLPPASIEVRLGAVWIPAADVEAFLHEVLELKDCKVAYSPQAGSWSVQCNDWTVRQSVKATQEFGTARMNAVQLVLCALNVQTPTVKDPVPDSDRYVVNAEQTLAAREKLGLLKDRFGDWAFEDLERRERLCGLYNRLFNATRPRKFDGQHLVLPGFSQCFRLHPQQLDAVWRIVQSGNTGLFHTVGAGKTAVSVMASMELRRLGFAAKPCHVVPNHMLLQV